MSTRTAAVAAALAALALTGCTTTTPSPPPAPAPSPAQADPTACEVNYDGAPDQPSWLHLDCQQSHWSLPGPWVDRQTQYLDDGAEMRGGLRFTKAIIVGGDARAWVSTATLGCVATRDLLDTDQATRVRCHLLDDQDETTTPSPSPSTASPPLLAREQHEQQGHHRQTERS